MKKISCTSLFHIVNSKTNNVANADQSLESNYAYPIIHWLVCIWAKLCDYLFTNFPAILRLNWMSK